jgi:hypothetical protein
MARKHYDWTRDGWVCEDCNDIVQPDRMFRFPDPLWLSIAGLDEMLCLPCAEKRLGRSATIEDFERVAIDKGLFRWKGWE